MSTRAGLRAAFGTGGTFTDVVIVGPLGRLFIDKILTLPDSVGAGGGRLAWIDDGGVLRVGPRSAEATPGSACYGRGGTEPTITDANVLLGGMNSRASTGGSVPIDAAPAQTAVVKPACAAGTDGPLIVEESDTAVVVLPDWRACLDDHANLVLDATEIA